MRVRFVSSVARCVCLCMLCVPYVCVTDDEEIGTNNSINTIVNCINCTLLTTLAQVTNAWTIHLNASSRFQTTKNKMPLALWAEHGTNPIRKFTLKSNLLILKVIFSRSRAVMVTNFAVLSITCGYNQYSMDFKSPALSVSQRILNGFFVVLY